LLLLVVALAWLLGPLRDMFASDPRFWPIEFWSVLWYLSPAIAVSAAWTWAVLWSVLTVEREWRRWGPALAAIGLGAFVLLGFPVLEGVMVFAILLFQIIWSAAVLLVVRRAGYRLVRRPRGGETV
jgi:hypothetical protein